VSKGGCSHLSVESQDHEDFEVDDIEDVVGKQGFQSFDVAFSAVFVPEQDRKKAVNAIQFFPVDSQLALTALETATISEACQDVAQVDMHLIHGSAEGIPDKRKIKTLAVIGDDHVVIQDRFPKVRQVFALNEPPDNPAVIKGNGGDGVGRGTHAGRLDVKVDEAFTKIGKKPPMLIRRELVGKKVWIVLLQVCSGLLEMPCKVVEAFRAEGQATVRRGPAEIVPRMYPLFPEEPFGPHPDPG